MLNRLLPAAVLTCAVLALGACVPPAEPAGPPTVRPTEPVTVATQPPAATQLPTATQPPVATIDKGTALLPPPGGGQGPISSGPGAIQPPGSTTGVVPVTPAQPPAPPSGDVITGEATVQNIAFLMLESFPVQVTAKITGYLADGCTTLSTIDQSYDAATKTFTVKLSTVRPKYELCTQMVVPFEQSIPLKVYGLPKGTYTVIANGKSATFELTNDNILPTP